MLSPLFICTDKRYLRAFLCDKNISGRLSRRFFVTTVMRVVFNGIRWKSTKINTQTQNKKKPEAKAVYHECHINLEVKCANVVYIIRNFTSKLSIFFSFLILYKNYNFARA